MLYRKISDKTSVPALGFGTFLLSGDDCVKAVNSAISSGYRLIDTAEAYGNEEEVGKGISLSAVPRSELTVVTKVNFKSYAKTRETIEKSLKKLKTDYLDLVLLHWPFADCYTAWRELEKLQKEGKIREIGVSNFEPDRLIDLISYNEVSPAVNQTETHLYSQRQTERRWEEKYGVSHMAYSPLGQGKADGMFAESEVKNLAEKYGKTPAQILLRKLVQEGIIAIPRSLDPRHIAENIDIFDFSLTEDEMSALRLLDKAAPMIGRLETPELVEMSRNW